MAQYNGASFDSTVWGGGSPIKPVLPSTAQTLLSMLAQIVSKGVFTADQVGLSLTKEPSLNVVANSYLTIMPGRESALDSQTGGMGRYGSGMRATATVMVYDRLALDVAYQDEQFLINSQGLRVLVFGVIDALQMFIPTDSNGVPLVEEPIRIQGNGPAFRDARGDLRGQRSTSMKWGSSSEWGYAELSFDIVYSRSCDPNIFV